MAWYHAFGPMMEGMRKNEEYELDRLAKELERAYRTEAIKQLVLQNEWYPRMREADLSRNEADIGRIAAETEKISKLLPRELERADLENQRLQWDISELDPLRKRLLLSDAAIKEFSADPLRMEELYGLNKELTRSQIERNRYRPTEYPPGYDANFELFYQSVKDQVPRDKAWLLYNIYQGRGGVLSGAMKDDGGAAPKPPGPAKLSPGDVSGWLDLLKGTGLLPSENTGVFRNIYDTIGSYLGIDTGAKMRKYDSLRVASLFARAAEGDAAAALEVAKMIPGESGAGIAPPPPPPQPSPKIPDEYKRELLMRLLGGAPPGIAQ